MRADHRLSSMFLSEYSDCVNTFAAISGHLTMLKEARFTTYNQLPVSFHVIWFNQQPSKNLCPGSQGHRLLSWTYISLLISIISPLCSSQLIPHPIKTLFPIHLVISTIHSHPKPKQKLAEQSGTHGIRSVVLYLKNSRFRQLFSHLLITL